MKLQVKDWRFTHNDRY